MSAATFLDVLFSSCDEGVVELRAYPSGNREWLPLRQWGTVKPFVERCSRVRDNAALGIATRRDTSNGTTANLAQLPGLFADLDVRPAEATRRLATFPFTPHAVVESGLGIHPYWLLKEPLDVSERHGCEYAAGLLRRLAHVLDSDERATDAARILRLPQSLNFKYGDPPRPVTLTHLRPGAIDVSEFDELLPREPRGPSAFLSEGAIPEGCRNDTLYRCGRSLRARGVPWPQIATTLNTLNDTRCHPPLPALEMAQLLKQVLTQPNRHDFQPLAVYRARQGKQEKQEKQEGRRP